MLRDDFLMFGEMHVPKFGAHEPDCNFSLFSSLRKDYRLGLIIDIILDRVRHLI